MRSDKDFITFLKGILKGKRALIVALALGLILLCALLPRLLSTEEKKGFNETEERIAELCSSVDGVGECLVMVTFVTDESGEMTGKVFSVAVICEGADSITVRARITELITSLYGIGANRVSVTKLAK